LLRSMLRRIDRVSGWSGWLGWSACDVGRPLIV
jgi:hypothetical protein